MNGPGSLSLASGELGTKQVSGDDFRKASVEAVVLLSLWVLFHTAHPSSHRVLYQECVERISGGSSIWIGKLLPSFALTSSEI